MARQGAVRISITGDASDLKRATQDGERSLNRLNKTGSSAMRKLGTAAKAGGLAIGAGMVVLGRTAIPAAVDLEEQVNKTRVVFRKSGKEVEDWSKTLASSFGISQRQALTAAGTLGNMLIPMGIARDRAADMSKRFVQLAADMASFNNASPEETLDAIRSGLAGESEPLRRFGVFLSETRVKAEALRLGFKEQGGQLTETAKAQARYNLILKDSRDAQGDFNRTSDSLANRQRQLRAQWDNLQAQLGKKVLPALVAVVEWINKMANAWQNRQGFAGAMRKAFENIGKAIKGTIELFRTFIRNIGNAVAGTLRMAATVARVVPGLGGLADKLDNAANKADKLGEKADDGRAALARLTSKPWPVNVSLKMGVESGIPGFKPFMPGPGQDGGPDRRFIERNVGDGIGAWVKGNKKGLANAFGPTLGMGPLSGKGVAQFQSIAQKFGLTLTSFVRPGDPGFHGQGRAMDFGGSPGAMLAFAKRMAGSYGNRLSELIHTPLGFGIDNRKVVPLSYWGSATNADHYDHVHVALQRGGTIPGAGDGDKVPVLAEPGEGFINKRAVKAMGGPSAINAINRLVPRFQKGGMVRAAKAARAAGFRGNALKIALAVAASESANFTDMTGDESLGGSYGPWMVHHPSHPEFNTSRLQSDWTYAARAAYKISGGGSNWSPWTQFRNGAYRAYLDDAARVLATGGVPSKKGPTPKQKRAEARRKKRAQRRRDRISMGAFAGRVRAANQGTFEGAFGVQSDFDIAMAGLTPGLQDDRAANVKALQGWLGFLEAGRRSGNVTMQTTAATGVKSAIDAIKSIDEELKGGAGGGNSLADALTELVEQTKQLKEVEKERATFEKSLAAIATHQAIGALADVISGQIGGKTASRALTAGDGYTVARY